MNKERRLGRGLEALLGRPFDPDGNYEQADGAPHAAPPGPARMAPVDRIDSNPYQPRRHFDDAELASLADSLQTVGVLQPLVVRACGDRYQLMAGERRLRAAQRAGLAEVPIQVVEADDRKLAEIAIIENLQRQDLNALEKGVAFSRYLETFQVTQEELARKLSIDRSTVSNLLRLLELPEEVQNALRQNRITTGHAKALLPLGHAHEQIALCERIIREGLSVRETEAASSEIVKREGRESWPTVLLPPRDERPAARAHNEQIASLEEELRRALGTRVVLQSNAKHRGKIVIHFDNLNEFERLRAILEGPQPARMAG